jgi:hypothetical protein
MAVLNIRNLPDDVHARLRIRAAKAGRSMEAEARAIITLVCTADEVPQHSSDLQKWVDSLYGAKKPRKVVASLVAERRRESAKE